MASVCHEFLAIVRRILGEGGRGPGHAGLVNQKDVFDHARATSRGPSIDENRRAPGSRRADTSARFELGAQQAIDLLAEFMARHPCSVFETATARAEFAFRSGLAPRAVLSGPAVTALRPQNEAANDQREKWIFHQWYPGFSRSRPLSCAATLSSQKMRQATQSRRTPFRNRAILQSYRNCIAKGAQ